MGMKWMIAAVVAQVWAGAAWAQGASDGFTVGALGILSSSPYAGEDMSGAVVPILAWKQGNLSISTEGVRLGLFDRDALTISALVAPRFPPFDGGTSGPLAGMDRGITADAGVLAEYALAEWTKVSLRAVTEVTGDRDGQEVTLGAQSRVAIAGIPMLLSGGAKWQSSGLSEFVYGVPASDAGVGRPAYAPGAVVVPYLSLGTMYPINERTRIFGSIKTEFLPGGVTDSPIIDAGVVTSLAVGVSFGF
jgi:outer membrane protein